MKKLIVAIFLFISALCTTVGQAGNPPENVVINSDNDKTRVQTNENGELLINVSPKDARRIKVTIADHSIAFNSSCILWRYIYE